MSYYLMKVIFIKISDNDKENQEKSNLNIWLALYTIEHNIFASFENFTNDDNLASKPKEQGKRNTKAIDRKYHMHLFIF